MSKIPPDNNVTELLRSRPQQPACRVAYTVNNTQPVLCTIIGDEPLFFMNYEEDFAEDTMLDDAFDFNLIEEGIATLQEKITGMGNMTDDFNSQTGSTIEAFLENADFITRPSDNSENDIEDLKIALRQSRLCTSYMDLATQHKTALRYSHEIENAIYDRSSNSIFINPNRTHGEQLLLAARELRHVWQHRNGALLHPLIFHPDQAILVNRAQAADLSVSMVRIAWELQLAGDNEAWEHLESSSMADLAATFARESALDFRTINNGMAASAVFESWFLSERCRQEDRRLIQQMLADYHGYVFEQEQPSKNVSAELICALGSMPFGKNYLAPFIGTITSDAIFTEVRDRSNANFLWFIKFERSFREAEQELQGDQSVRHRDITHGDTHIKNNGRIGDHEETADIIALPRSGTAPPTGAHSGEQRRTASAGNSSANIITFLPRGGEG